MKSLLALLLMMNTAYGATERKLPAQFCDKSAAQLDALELECADNDKFIDEAENCAIKLNNYSKAQAKSIKFLGGNDSQQKNFGSATKDYATAVANLTYLIALTKQVSKEIEAYLNVLTRPDEADEENISDEDAEKIALNSDCFGQTRKAVLSVVDETDEQVKKLEAAKAAALANAGNTLGSEGKLDALTTDTKILDAVKGGKGYPSAPAPKLRGTDQEPRSDISGTEKLKKK